MTKFQELFLSLLVRAVPSEKAALDHWILRLTPYDESESSSQTLCLGRQKTEENGQCLNNGLSHFLPDVSADYLTCLCFCLCDVL